MIAITFKDFVHNFGGFSLIFNNSVNFVFFVLFAKLIFNFNFNLVERWDGYILIWSSHPATHPTIRHITTMTSNMKQRTKTKELDELQDELDELYELDELWQ